MEPDKRDLVVELAGLRNLSLRQFWESALVIRHGDAGMIAETMEDARKEDARIAAETGDDPTSEGFWSEVNDPPGENAPKPFGAEIPKPKTVRHSQSPHEPIKLGGALREVKPVEEPENAPTKLGKLLGPAFRPNQKD